METLKLTMVIFIYSFINWQGCNAAKPTPVYKYLKELCPPLMIPLTSTKHVRTCKDLCPLDAQCIQGICCVKPPTCKDLTYRFPTFYSCLPSVKQNCPESTKCTPSSRAGMNICCSIKKMMNNREPKPKAEGGICPASHPVVSHDNSQLLPCSSCKDGICVAFRNSNVRVCCHSYATLCGPDSVVEMDGYLARDCSKNSCSSGFECSLSSSGHRVCCSLAVCSSGAKARGVCAGGCRRNEQCEELNGQRWCCPKMESCPDNRKNNGKSCSLSNTKCARGYECMQSEKGLSWLCCEVSEPLTTAISLITTPRKSRPGVTRRLLPEPVCDTSDEPLIYEGEYMTCPEEGAPCPKGGYTCQTTSVNRLYCCPLPESVEEEEQEETTTRRPTTRKIVAGKQSLAKIFKEITAPPLIKIPSEQGNEAPKCHPDYVAARSQLNNEYKRCAGWLDFSCPFGFICQPSTTSAGFLCCGKVSKN